MFANIKPRKGGRQRKIVEKLQRRRKLQKDKLFEGTLLNTTSLLPRRKMRQSRPELHSIEDLKLGWYLTSKGTDNF